VALVWDISPASIVFLRLKPYLSTALPAAALAGAGLLGVAVSLGAILAARQAGRRPWAAAAGVAPIALVVGLLLWRVDAEEQLDRPRHPAGIERQFTPSMRILSGLNVPTGLAIAPNGDLAVVELQGAGFHLYQPQGAGFVERIATRFPVSDHLMAFHVAFHPQYPEQPYVYASVEEQGEGQRMLQLFRGRIDGAEVTWQALVRGLPNAQIEEGGNHHGSGIAVCGGYLFLGIGDTEAHADESDALTDPWVVRDEAQDLGSLRGKILRWRLSGADLVEAPAILTAGPIFAYGVRNPFALGCEQRTGTLLLADNGPGGHDQVRLVPPASNHEWPLSTERNNLALPLFDSGSAHIAPTGIAWRAAGEGADIVFTAFQARAVYLLPLSPEGQSGTLRLLAEPETGAYAVASDARGCTYFSDVDSVWRLEDGHCGQ
jgi:glucose/arabinose dehydrogenase